jgi:anti-anti-sigma factor
MSNKNILKIDKDLTESKTEPLEKKLLKIFEDGDKDIVLDFSKADAVDFVGIGFVLAACNTAKREGGRLGLIHVPDQISGMFHAMRLDRYLDIG